MEIFNTWLIVGWIIVIAMVLVIDTVKQRYRKEDSKSEIVWTDDPDQKSYKGKHEKKS